jgi:hypothetical protein
VAGVVGAAMGASRLPEAASEQPLRMTRVDFSDTYVTRLDTVAAETSKTIREITTSKPGAVFAEVVDSVSSNGVVDPVLQYGYNIGQSGSRRNPAEPSWCMTLEGGWLNAASGHEQVEWHIQYNGVAGVKRPLSVAVDKVTGHMSTAIQLTSGAANSIGTPFAFLDEQGAGIFTFTGSSWHVKDPFIVQGGRDGILNLGDAVINRGVQFNLKAATGNTIYQTWNEGPSQRWIDYMPPGASTPRYMRDVLNAKMHVTYQPGAGTGGGSTSFDCKVAAHSLDIQTAAKLRGNVGFYGSEPVGKPVVSGARSGGAALTSLLKALAVLGLVTDSTVG